MRVYKKKRDTEMSNITCVTHTQRLLQIADDAISNLKKCVPSKHFLHGLTLKSTVAQFTLHTYAKDKLWNKITKKIMLELLANLAQT